VRTFFGGNTNTQYFNDFLDPPVEQASSFAGISATAGYVATAPGGLRYGVELRGDALWNFNDDAAPGFDSPSDYSFQAGELALFVARPFDTAAGPGEASSILRYRLEDAASVDGVGSATLSLDLAVQAPLGGGWDGGLTLSFAQQDFDTGFDAFDPASVRDGRYRSLTASLGRAVAFGPVYRVDIGLGLDGYDADGANWT